MKILFSAYYCNPYDTSEAYGAFEWIKILLTKYDVIVLTNQESEKGIIQYYKYALPSNLEILAFNDDNFFKRNIKAQLHFGYFTFNKNIKQFIKKGSSQLNGVKVAIHKNPSSFRYFTCLTDLNVPLILGPLGGGLQVPKVLKAYFKSEQRVNKLRKFDWLLFKLPVYKRLYNNASKILISFDYLLKTLPEKYHHKTKTFFDTGVAVEDDIIIRRKKIDSPIKILYVGKLIRYKGAELAIKAISELKDLNIHFDLLGEGVEFDYLKQLVNKLNLESKVSFYGNVNREKVDLFYKNADIFCFPSLTEAGGTVFLEAMKFSLPIISINNGGPKYLCPNEGTLRIDIDTPEKMIENIAKSIKILLDDRKRRIEMGKINYEHCKANYSWEVSRERILNLFEEYESFKYN